MSRFAKKFLREGEGIFSRKNKPLVYLAAYGKHPGWDDHIDDIGLETESLLLSKHVLYVDGIGGQIDSGNWDKLIEPQRLPEFKHVILWKRSKAFLLGRIWSSRDGKNRTKYPMIVCVHCLHVPLSWGLTNVLPVLERLETVCKNTNSAQDVRDIVQQSVAELRQSLQTPLVAQSDGGPLRFIDRLELADAQEKLLRISYHLCTRLASFSSRDGGQFAAGQIRLPAASGSVSDTLHFWSRYLESELGPDIPVLLALPLKESWLDAISGQPTARELYSLRVTPEVLAVASEVPYDIDEEFRKAHQGMIEAVISA
jgi:hypothetical protein